MPRPAASPQALEVPRQPPEDAPPRRQRRRRGGRLRIPVAIPRKIWAEEVRAGGHNPALRPRRRLRGRPCVRGARRTSRRRATTPASCSAGPASGFSPSGSARSSRRRSAPPPVRRSPTSGRWAACSRRRRGDRSLYELMIELEEELGFHLPSFSATTCVYKVMGAPVCSGSTTPTCSTSASRPSAASVTTATPPTPGPRSGAASSRSSGTTARSTRSSNCDRRRGCWASTVPAGGSTPRTSTGRSTI